MDAPTKLGGAMMAILRIFWLAAAMLAATFAPASAEN
jgi:hypothetical protein